MSSALTVYGGWEAEGIADFSPFCLKVKTYLRMTGVPYTTKMGDPRTAPTKKIPYIDDGGTIVGDSGIILDYLKKKHGDKLDAGLTPAQHAQGHLVRRTLEESLYFVGLHARWVDDANFPTVAKLMAPLMPPVIGSLLINGPVRGAVKKQAFMQGIGRHTREHIDAIGCADVDAIAATLGDRPWLLGSAPTSYDAILYSFATNILGFPKTSAVSKRTASHANLVAYCDRVRAKYWATPDVPAAKA
jgi:glutathione S-transferase